MTLANDEATWFQTVSQIAIRFITSGAWFDCINNNININTRSPSASKMRDEYITHVKANAPILVNDGNCGVITVILCVLHWGKLGDLRYNYKLSGDALDWSDAEILNWLEARGVSQRTITSAKPCINRLRKHVEPRYRWKARSKNAFDVAEGCVLELVNNSAQYARLRGSVLFTLAKLINDPKRDVDLVYDAVRKIQDNYLHALPYRPATTVGRWYLMLLLVEHYSEEACGKHLTLGKIVSELSITPRVSTIVDMFELFEYEAVQDDAPTPPTPSLPSDLFIRALGKRLDNLTAIDKKTLVGKVEEMLDGVGQTKEHSDTITAVINSLTGTTTAECVNANVGTVWTGYLVLFMRWEWFESLRSKYFEPAAMRDWDVDRIHKWLNVRFQSKFSTLLDVIVRTLKNAQPEQVTHSVAPSGAERVKLEDLAVAYGAGPNTLNKLKEIPLPPSLAREKDDAHAAAAYALRMHEDFTAHLEQVLNPTTGETQMATIDPTKALQTVNYVYGKDFDAMNDGEVFDRIALLEQEIAALDKIDNKPKKLVAKIESLRADIKTLSDLVDAR